MSTKTLPSNSLLLRRLEVLHARVMSGDPKAKALVERAKKRAKAGDRKAAMVFNTVASLHWRARQKPQWWNKLEAFYLRLGADDKAAWTLMRRIKEKAEAKDDTAKRAFASLKAIHNQRKVSVWYPGAPKIGAYPMPNIHRAGIDIPGLGSFPDVPGLPGMPGGMPAIPGLPAIPGGMPAIPGLPGGMPGLPGVPGLALPGPQYNPPGIQPGYGPAPGTFLPLTPQAAMGLLSMLARAVQSMPGMPGLEMSSNPMAESADGVMSTVPEPSGSFTASDVFKPPSLNMIRAQQALEGKQAGQTIKAMGRAKPTTLPQKYQANLKTTATAQTRARALDYFK